MVRLLAGASAASLLDHDEDTWLAHADGVVNDTRSRALLLYAHRAVADLAESGGWEAEYLRDVWRMHRLGFDGHHTLQFDRIRATLAAGADQALGPAAAVKRAGLGSRRRTPGGGDHPVLAVPHRRSTSSTSASWIGSCSNATWQTWEPNAIPQRRGSPHRPAERILYRDPPTSLADRLPATAVFFAAGSSPAAPNSCPGRWPNTVMTQLEHPDNLDRFNNPSYRLITVILMRCGLRITDALRLRCIPFPLLRPDPTARPRLEQIRDNLIARITEAESHRWYGEAEGLKVSLAGAHAKLAQMDQITTRRTTAVQLGIPTFTDTAGRTTTSDTTEPHCRNHP